MITLPNKNGELTDYYYVEEVAKIEKLKTRRIIAKIAQGFHYPSARRLSDKKTAPWVIPKSDLKISF